LKPHERDPAGHVPRPPHRKDRPAEVTLVVQSGLPSLRKTAAIRHRIEACVTAHREKHADETAFQVLSFRLDDDRLHVTVEATDKRVLTRGVMGLSIRIARAINTLLGRTGRFWAERYHRRTV
jgi:hypothetical protein